MTSEPPREPADGSRDPDDEIPQAPWSFKIMVALAVLYLGWRLVQGVMWLIDRLF